MSTPQRLGSARVTGASSGVGRALALALAQCCEEVLLTGREGARLAEVAASVEAEGAGSESFVTDLRDRNAPGELARAIMASRTALGVLVHSAGVFVSGLVGATPEEDLELALDINLRAPYLLTRALLPALGAGKGDVVFINSSAVGQRKAGLAAYGASKHGLVGVADSLRQELNPSGVRVLSVFLGATATPMQEHIYRESGRHYQPEALLAPADVARIVCDVIRLPRGAEVTDLHVRPAAPHRPG
jgi:NAD(P)-dependent dehydrogenase (short-subunit alcohol dehydrogenase family)